MIPDDFALLILESPWWTPKENPSRASCLPFFQGLEKLYDRFNIYYSTFYDTAGFEAALHNDLARTTEKKQIVYVGAHGNSSSIADGRASTVLKKIGFYAPKAEAVIVSSCMVGTRDDVLRTPFYASNTIRWVFGYSCSIDWLTSTLLEVSLLEAILENDEYEPADERQVIKTFATALSRYNPNSLVGFDTNTQQQVKLSESIKIHHRAYKKSYLQIEDLSIKIAAAAWN